jgi:hypothetical protein
VRLRTDLPLYSVQAAARRSGGSRQTFIMKTRILVLTALRCATALAALQGLQALAAPAGAASAGSASSAERAREATYQHDRARCLDGQSTQNRASCLAEASAALAADRQGKLHDADAATLADNAAKRCMAQPAGPARADCVRLMRRDGPSADQVDGDGQIQVRRTYELEPAASSPAAR